MLPPIKRPICSDVFSDRSFSRPKETLATGRRFIDSEVWVGSAHKASEVTAYERLKNDSGLSKSLRIPATTEWMKSDDPALRWSCLFSERVLTFETL
jgi:hypothetical protein